MRRGISGMYRIRIGTGLSEGGYGGAVCGRDEHGQDERNCGGIFGTIRLLKVCQKAHLLFFTHKAQEGVSKSTPSFLYDKAPTFTSWGFVIT